MTVKKTMLRETHAASLLSESEKGEKADHEKGENKGTFHGRDPFCSVHFVFSLV